MLKNGILFVIMFIVLASSVSAADQYVNNAASGSNSGTSWANAWESFADITWDSVQSGDTIYISGGSTSKTYYETLNIGASGTSGNHINIRVGQNSPHNGRVIIEGSGSVSTGIVVSGYEYVTISGRVGDGSDQHIISRNHYTNEIRMDRNDHVIIEYIEAGPSDASNYGVYITNYAVSGAGGNRVSNCEIHTLRRIPILASGPGGPTINDDHLRIDHNNIYNFGEDGIHAGGGAGGITIDHNEIHDPSDISEWGGYSDGMQLRGFHYLTVAYNKVYNMENADGMYSYLYFECDLGQSNVAANDIYIYNNVIYETDHTYTSSGHTGISFGCKACATMTNVEVSNNILVDLGSRGLDFGPGPAGPATSNTYIMNNIVYNGDRGNFGAPVVSLNPNGASTGSLGDGTDIEWDYNLVDRYGAGDLRARFDGSTVDYPTTWKTNSGCDDNGQTSDPTFVDWSEGNAIDLHLASGSVGIDMGTTRTEFNDDFDGNTRVAPWDIGAYEYGGTLPTCTGYCCPSGYTCSQSGIGSCSSGTCCLNQASCTQQPSCPDGTCDPGETCSSCPADCPTGSGQECCSGTIYTGDCCDNSNCNTGYYCNSNHVCTEETSGAEIIIDNLDSGFTSTGSWMASAYPDPYGANSVYSDVNEGSTATWTPSISQAGNYEVYTWWTAGDGRINDAKYTINYAGGSDLVVVDQKTNGGQWNYLGTYNFNSATSGSVSISDESTDSNYVPGSISDSVCADAVRFLMTDGSACGDADGDDNGIVSINELINYIGEWKAGTVSISDLMIAIGEWKGGC